MCRVLGSLLCSSLVVLAAGKPAWPQSLESSAGPASVAASPRASEAPAARDEAPQAAPSGYAAEVFAGLKWKNIGPNRGGRSTAVAGSAARPLEYYFGATGGGLWKTTDGGLTWKPVGDAAFKTSSVGAVTVAPSNPDIVYVGMGETQLRGNVIQGDGVYKTTDGGKTWTHVGLERTRAIARIRVHPDNPDVAYVAALGDPYAATPDRGVYRTRDGGQTWDRVLFRSERAGAADLSMDARDPSILFASLWEAHRTPHSLSSGGPGSGLLKSTDGGATWQDLTRNPGLSAGMWGKVGVAVSPVDSNRVYAIVENADGGVFASDDGGATWRQVSADRKLRQRAFYYTRIYADPKERDTVYVLNTAFYRSADGGKTYKAIRVPHGDNHDLWIAPDDPKRMINSNDGGANVSTNGGDTWSRQDVPTAQFYNVVTTKHVPYHVCGAQQDNTTACVPSTGGPLYTVGGCESGYVAPDPADVDVFFAGCYGGSLTRFDRRTNQARAVNIWPDNPMGYSAKDLRERFQWTFPIVFSPLDGSTLYASSQHLWRTTNAGQSWERISPDLTRADPSTLGPSGGPITLDQTGVETYGTIFTVAPSRFDKDTIWTGSDDGVASITRDGGRTWKTVTPGGLPPFARISLIEASPHRAGTAFLAANAYQRGDRAPYVYRTDDYGESWTKVVDGVAGDDFARSVREDPVRQGLVYLGTEHGIYLSFDDGRHWQSLRLELPVTPVHGIAIEGQDLVIGTHGRSFWVLPGLGVLRQLSPEVVAADAWLFEPADVVRYRIGGGGFGSGVPSATLDYYLGNDADAVTIEILDASGQVVRTLKTTASDAKQAEEKKKQREEGMTDPDEDTGPPPVILGLKKGHNRVAWDLRYDGAASFPRLIMWAASTRGPLAPPGRYSVRLTAGGQTRTREFSIARDPRLEGVTDADLQAQFELARSLRDRLSQANEAVMRIRGIKAAVAEKGELARDRDVTRAAATLSGHLTEVEGEIYQYRNQSSQDPLNYPIKLNNKLGALMGVVESADAKPTDQSYAVFKELSAALDQQLARLDAVLAADVPPLNVLLARRKIAPLEVGSKQ